VRDIKQLPKEEQRPFLTHVMKKNYEDARGVAEILRKESRQPLVVPCIFEAAEQNWSTRDLQRQLDTQYYERILAHHPKEVPSIPIAKNELEKSKPSDVIKDPFVMEFLNINGEVLASKDSVVHADSPWEQLLVS